MPEPHRHYWSPLPDDPRFERCAHADCGKERHRPLRHGEATVCPGTPDGEHQWQPLSFVFETQLLGAEGRVIVRQPSIDEGRVYAVCMPCRSHTYIVTAWVGYHLGHPFYEEEEARRAES
ncbi:hypothetical protein ACIOC2_19230 [Streptomyces sp. NPDC088337]|uniref:hypothetical protein n=1 Tax=unclassified Streptomyces TaxID=2593676 RepID=UPI0038195CCD